MRSRMMTALVLLTLLFSLVAAPGARATPSTQAGARERVIVQFQPGRKAAMLRDLAGIGGEVHLELDALDAVAVTVPVAALDGLRRNPNVVLVEPDVIRVPLATGGETVPYGVDMVQARDLWDANRDGAVDAGAPTGAGITICIIDSGVSVGHEDLAGLAIVGGYPSGWDTDTCGHGTHVAGTIAAALNGKGVVGVTPGIGGPSLYFVQVFSGAACGWTYSSTLANAASRCEAAGARIISMSLGGSRSSQTERRAFDGLYSRGVLNIAAAGNDGSTAYHYPASYNSVISVAALDANKVVATFSQQNNQVELAAPGVAVLSTVPWLAEDSLTVDGVPYQANHIEYAATNQTVTAALASGDRCTATDAAWSGKVVLCERGDVSFYDKVRNVQLSGGVAAVIYNNEPGNFFGTLGDGNSSTIVAISISQADGLDLVDNKLGQQATVTSSYVYPGNGYEAWDGTSMATPHVSGVAALVWSAAPTKTNVQIREALAATAQDLGAAGRDNAYGWGLVQAYAAWQFLGGGPPPNEPPVAAFSYACTGLSCTFDASASTDPDGSLVGYAWTFGDGNTGSGVEAAHTYAADGSYTVTLTVTDNDGASASTSETVTVSGGDVTPPVISGVSVRKIGGSGRFTISWVTDEPATTEVTLNGVTYSDPALVLNHAMTFSGVRGATYTYYVRSTDAAGNTAEAGPFTHQN